MGSFLYLDVETHLLQIMRLLAFALLAASGFEKDSIRWPHVCSVLLCAGGLTHWTLSKSSFCKPLTSSISEICAGLLMLRWRGT